MWLFFLIVLFGFWLAAQANYNLCSLCVFYCIHNYTNSRNPIQDRYLCMWFGVRLFPAKEQSSMHQFTTKHSLAKLLLWICNQTILLDALILLQQYRVIFKKVICQNVEKHWRTKHPGAHKCGLTSHWDLHFHRLFHLVSLLHPVLSLFSTTSIHLQQPRMCLGGRYVS